MPRFSTSISAAKSVYPVADMLEARGMPFFFMTGYGSASIDPRFADVPVLQKPVEAKRWNTCC